MKEQSREFRYILAGAYWGTAVLYLQTPADELGALRSRLVWLGGDNNESYAIFKEGDEDTLRNITAILDKEAIDYQVTRIKD